MKKFYTTTIELHIDPFEATGEDNAQEIIDRYLDLLTDYANSLLNPAVTWGECDTTPIIEMACPRCDDKGEVIVYDSNGLPMLDDCDCVESEVK